MPSLSGCGLGAARLRCIRYRAADAISPSISRAGGGTVLQRPLQTSE